MKLNIPRPHTDFELKNKIDFHKWVVLLATIGISTSAALYHYFNIGDTWPIYFYLVGWVCLTVCIWIEFQAVLVMSSTRFYQVPGFKKAKVEMDFEKILKSSNHHKVAVSIISTFIHFFTGLVLAPYVAVLFFIVGFVSLGIAIFMPIFISNIYKILLVIIAVILIYWIGDLIIKILKKLLTRYLKTLENTK